MQHCLTIHVSAWPLPCHLLTSINFTGCQCNILVFKLPSHWIRYDKSVNFIGYKKSLRGRIVEENIKARLQTIYCFFQQQRRKFHSLSCNGSFHKALIMQLMNTALQFFAIFLYIPLIWACPHLKKCPALNMSAQEQTWSCCMVQGWFLLRGSYPMLANIQLARNSRRWVQSFGVAL